MQSAWVSPAAALRGPLQIVRLGLAPQMHSLTRVSDGQLGADARHLERAGKGSKAFHSVNSEMHARIPVFALDVIGADFGDPSVGGGLLSLVCGPCLLSTTKPKTPSALPISPLAPAAPRPTTRWPGSPAAAPAAAPAWSRASASPASSGDARAHVRKRAETGDARTRTGLLCKIGAGFACPCPFLLTLQAGLRAAFVLRLPSLPGWKRGGERSGGRGRAEFGRERVGQGSEGGRGAFKCGGNKVPLLHSDPSAPQVCALCRAGPASRRLLCSDLDP